MKKTFLKFAGAILAIAFIGVSCTEDDITPPEITITGEKTVIIELGDTYTDAGATANDDKNGDLTSQITVVNPVKTDEVGTYIVEYSFSDKAGNKGTATRTVIVKANKLAGSYNCHYVVTGFWPDEFNGTETITGSGVTPFNKLMIANLGGYTGFNGEATCAGKNILINMTKTFDWDQDGTATEATFSGTTANALSNHRCCCFCRNY